MAIETTQSEPQDSLDAQLDSLLNLSATEDPARTGTIAIAPPEHASQTAESPGTASTIEDQLKSLLAGELAHVVDGSKPVAAETQEEALTPEPAPIPVISPPAPMPRGSGLSAAVPNSVEDLDAQLANLTESLLAETSAIEAEEAAKRAAAAAEESARQAAASAAAASATGPISHSDSSASHSSSHADAAHSRANPASDSRPPNNGGHASGPAHNASGGNTLAAKIAAHAEHRNESPNIKAADTVRDTKVKAVLQGAAKLGQNATPVGVRALALLNKPMQGVSATVRDSLGWVAVWTLFLAASVWTFAVFFQKPPEHAVPHDAPKIASDDTESAQPEAAKSGHSDSHAAAPAGKNATDEHEKPAERKAATADHDAPATGKDDHGGH